MKLSPFTKIAIVFGIFGVAYYALFMLGRTQQIIPFILTPFFSWTTLIVLAISFILCYIFRSLGNKFAWWSALIMFLVGSIGFFPFSVIFFHGEDAIGAIVLLYLMPVFALIWLLVNLAMIPIVKKFFPLAPTDFERMLPREINADEK